MASSVQNASGLASSQYPAYASVVLDVYMEKSLEYGVPQELIKDLKKGCRVQVPLRGRPCKGYVIEVHPQSSFPKVSPIQEICDGGRALPEDLFQLGLWIARYYSCPLSQAFKVLVPSSIRKDAKAKEQLSITRAKTREQLVETVKTIREKKPAQGRVLEVMLKAKKGLLLTELLEESQASRSAVDALVESGHLRKEVVQVDRSPLEGQEYFKTKAKKLNPEQDAALQEIVLDLQADKYRTHLLFGVTGSGKTEVYLQAIEEALKTGKGTIMLVPEISLTTQTVERFRGRFDDRIAILHHRLSQGERFDEWNRIARGEAKIVIGARSAIFSPMPNLGLIIVDEEHESSFKQSEEAPCYHARDVAVMRGFLTKSVVVLGSATPSMESYFNAQQGKYRLSVLSSRADSARLPQVHMVDMKREIEQQGGFSAFSRPLLDGIKKRLENGEQALLFLNRRGYHSSQFCGSCGHVMKCQHCDTALTYHRGSHCLACHLCGFHISPPPRECPACKSQETLKYKGMGTEQVERALHAIFPDLRTLRMDADTTRHKGSHDRLISAFRTGKADVLVGTQMIAKGLHFPQVTLVGILNCDGPLNLPDFHASENTFQLVTQVAGRAGRGALAGEVIIQTYLPENSTLQLAARQDFVSFYQEEIQVREIFQYPPFSHLAKFSFSGKRERSVQDAALRVREALLHRLSADYEIHPVNPCGHAKVKDYFRFQFLVKGPSVYFLNQQVEAVRQALGSFSGIRWSLDIDPSSTFF